MTLSIAPADAFVIAVEATLPSYRIQVLDGDVPADLSNVTAQLHFYRDGTDETLPAIVDESWITHEWLPTETTAPKQLTAAVELTASAGVSILPAPPVAIYDPADLWADPALVKSLVGSGYSDSQVILAILAAQQSITAYVTVPIPEPTPPAVRQATTILAARILGGATASSDQAPIVSEQIGDYSVRYAYPQVFGAAWLIDPNSDIGHLLAPWRPAVADMFIGHRDHIYPISPEEVAV